MFIIYKATNLINGLSYVGFSKHSLKKRRNQHVAQAKCNFRSGRKLRKFEQGIVEFGVESFVWEVLFESWDETYCLHTAEDLLISSYGTYEGGYNSAKGGQGSPGCFGERNGMFGKTHTDEVKAKLSALGKLRTGSNNPAYGIKRPDLVAYSKRPKLWMTKDGLDTQVLIEREQIFIDNGYVRGRHKIRGPKYDRDVCVGCGLVVRDRNKFCSRACANKTNGSIRKTQIRTNVNIFAAAVNTNTHIPATATDVPTSMPFVSVPQNSTASAAVIVE